MAVKQKPGAGKKGVTVDFSGVESGGGRAVDDGEYLAEVTSVSEEESSEGNPYLGWKWKIIEAGDAKGATIYDNTSLQPQALWRLKGLLEVLGFDIPDSAMTIDLKGLVGKKAKLEITNEEYRGKQKPRVTAFNGASEAAASKAKSKLKPGEGDEPDDEDEDEDDSPKFKKGQKVSFKDEDGTRYKGVVVSVEGDTATVKVDDDEYEVETDQLKTL